MSNSLRRPNPSMLYRTSLWKSVAGQGMLLRCLWSGIIATLLCSPALVKADDSPKKVQQFRTMLVGTLSLPDEEFLAFAEEVKPKMIVMGAFGAPQWVAQPNRREWLEKWKAIFARMHRSDIQVVGMIELLNAGNTPEEAKKFVDFFDNDWDETLLGKKPRARGVDLLEVRAMSLEKQSGAFAPRGCAVNPHWRAVEKAFVRAMINAGIDGFITHRNMFGECGCPFCHADIEGKRSADGKQNHPKHDHTAHAKNEHPCSLCEGGFRRWLAGRYNRAELQAQLNIRDLATHRLPAIFSHHQEHLRLPTPLELEGMKYARHAIKAAFDDVFVNYARRVKPDLVIAQWNHMPYFDELHLDGGHIPRFHLTTFAHASANERWSLPIERWGQGEDFYWYCNWGTCQNTQLEKRFLADVTLYAKLLRSFARGKPYLINKYDFYRPRNMMAEAAALGMVAGAIAVPYRTEEDRRVMRRYFDFLREHHDLYDGGNGEAISDVLLVHPRSATHAGRAEGLEMIEVAGRTMITEHIQFDFVPDDLLGTVKLDRYQTVIAADPVGLEISRWKKYCDSGGTVIAVPSSAKLAADPRWKAMGATVVSGLQPHTGGKPGAEPLRKALFKSLAGPHAKFQAPYTVEPHVYRQAGRYVIHLVNYNHREKAPGKSSVEREAPIPAAPVSIRLPLRVGETVKKIRFLDPDAKETRDLAFDQQGGILNTQSPSFTVYGVCVIEIQKSP